MKFHVLIGPKCLTEADLENSALRHSFNEQKKELINTVKHLRKKEPGHHSATPYYLHDEHSMRQLANDVDEHHAEHPIKIILHGDGYPFLVGLETISHYSLTPYQVAKRFADALFPKDLNFIIQVITCNSATNFHKINFSKLLSKSLYKAFGFENVVVIGYTGYIHVKNTPGKFSVTTEFIRDRSGTHASLEDASQTYLNGKSIGSGRVLLDLTASDSDYSWAVPFIEQITVENKIRYNPSKKSNSNAKHTSNDSNSSTTIDSSVVGRESIFSMTNSAESSPNSSIDFSALKQKLSQHPSVNESDCTDSISSSSLSKDLSIFAECSSAASSLASSVDMSELEQKLSAISLSR